MGKVACAQDFQQLGGEGVKEGQRDWTDTASCPCAVLELGWNYHAR